MPEFSHSLAVVTGASAGIGREFAEQMAARGHPLLLAARNEARLGRAADELHGRYGVSVRALAADLAEDDGRERLARALEAEPEVGVLVNNAGFGTKGPIHTTPLDAQMRMLRLHVLTPMRLCRAVLPGMVSRGRGWIVNVSSIAGYMYGPGNANYCATKAYLTRFTLALDTELQRTGVRVQALCPGFTHSEFHDRMEIDKRTIPAFLWMDAERVVRESLRAVARGRPVAFTPGIRNRLMTMFVEMLPHALVRRGRRVGE